jgi:hypothetical protein
MDLRQAFYILTAGFGLYNLARGLGLFVIIFFRLAGYPPNYNHTVTSDLCDAIFYILAALVWLIGGLLIPRFLYKRLA